MTYKDSLAIVPATSTTSLSLLKSDFDHIHSKMQTMNRSQMQTMTDSITDILQKLTDGSSKTDTHDEQITEISSKLSYYEDRLNELIIKDTYIQPLYLQITNTSPKTDKHE